ncbi:MAG: DNRLRE domain-containing protein [Planctomycetota bacterium]
MNNTHKLALAALLAAPTAALAQLDNSFTLVALPDTQNYVTSSTRTLGFNAQTQWIADEVNGTNDRNIKFVTHLGDMVSSGDSFTQLNRANTAMSTLDGVVPYRTLPGNHDYASTGNKSTGTDAYRNFFGPDRYAGQSWFGGADASGNNMYQRFSAGGYDFIHLALEWRPDVNIPFRTESPLDWAQSIIDANPDTPVILSTHEHLDDNPAGRSGSGENVWNQLISRNDQIFMVLNGHYHSRPANEPFNDGEFHQVSDNLAGRQVIEVLQDYQDYPNGGDGWLRLIDFQPDNNRIEFETYSPVLDEFQTETVADVGGFASRFGFDFDFATRLDPVAIVPPPPPPGPDFALTEGVDGYFGTQDKEIRFSGGDENNGQFDEISVDGDDGSPGAQPNHGLIRFDNIVAELTSADIAAGDIDNVVLKLKVNNPGSGFNVHEMLVSWDESTTWVDLAGGVQPDDVEAVAEAIATFGADNFNENVPTGTLEIDVTESILAYLDGSLDNLGWALIPFPDGGNGIDFYTSEFADPSLRPTLEVTLIPEPTSLALLGLSSLTLLRRRR